ncbi:transcription factor domain-containing protein [Aspergillus ibericus CBS 121593]|uniref:Fungal-specific transcription factor n=1 Tax=Aspergillus ibericus CBS 121593 TaxID=1448316 RepID=A0A395GPE8_9EURO|nr:fungal-specific transcription factor [Aspergillus ibericus CBS 121593]RAK97349.1 fungal-specific transcription factor [Aspergillus ibericus CBS 121593]
MSTDSDNAASTSTVLPPGSKSPPPVRDVTHIMLSGLKDENTRSLLRSNVFCHLDNVWSRFFENEKCIQAVEAALVEIAELEDTTVSEVQAPPAIPNETASSWINKYYDTYQFEGFRIPFERSFILSISDLLDSPHVQFDSTIQLVYYNVLFQGLLLDSEPHPNKGSIIQLLCRKSMDLTESWLSQIKNTPADLFTAFFMMSMALESCNSELSWKILGHACAIARALGYFSVDADQSTHNSPASLINAPSEPEIEIEKNRKRFEFWHLLRTDCLFRLSFGKPALIAEGSWAVNFPDPSITGVDDESTRFVQIHFLASMRLTLVLLRYLDLVDVESGLSTSQYDETIDGLIKEVQTIMSDWTPEELLTTTTNRTDTWFCVDILFSSYKMLIVFYQSKKCYQSGQILPYHTVDIARKSLQMSRSIMSSTPQPYWGISLILLHQFIPLFIVSMDMIGSPERHDMELDLDLVAWFNHFVETASQERTELRPLSAILKAMALASRNAKVGSE